MTDKVSHARTHARGIVNPDVDPRMIGMEACDAKHGRQFDRPYRILARQHQTDGAPGFVPTRIIRHVGRRPYREATAS